MPLRAGFRAAMAAAICLVLQSAGLAHDGPHQHWLESLRRPGASLDFDDVGVNQSCCGQADIVKTKFKVENTGGPYPEDRWYAWLYESWMPIPPETILQEYAPNGEAFLFVFAGTIRCFVRPKGGI
jgi:hypothetical protein